MQVAAGRVALLADLADLLAGCDGLAAADGDGLPCGRTRWSASPAPVVTLTSCGPAQPWVVSISMVPAWAA